MAYDLPASWLGRHGRIEGPRSTPNAVAPVTINDVVDRSDVVRALRVFMRKRYFLAFSLTHYDVGMAMFWWTLRKVFTVLRSMYVELPDFNTLGLPVAHTERAKLT